MPTGRDRIVLALSLSALVGLGLAWSNLWVAFGFVVWLVMIQCQALGYGSEAARPPVLYALLGFLGLYCLLFSAMVLLGDPESHLYLFLGLPVRTALLVYGIWPLGIFLGVLYFVVFERAVLPPKKLEEFFSQFGHRK